MREYSLFKNLSVLLVFVSLVGMMSDGLARERDNRRGNRNRNVEARRERADRNGSARANRSERRNRREQRVERQDRRARREQRVERQERRARREQRVERRERRERREQRVERRERREQRVERRQRNFRRNTHIPYRRVQRHLRRYDRPYRYHRTVARNHVFMSRWVRLLVSLHDGYHYYNDYPYFIYNGYRHRYSHLDYCNYELVDSDDYSVRNDYYAYTCNTGYDRCSERRDDLNDLYGYNRFFCSEKVDDDYFRNW
jgi:hypothetical protein